MSNAIVKADYEAFEMIFTEKAWFNATRAADHFGKRVQDWLDNAETKEYMIALVEFHNHANQRELIRSPDEFISAKRGKNGGTWLHPDLAVAYARWLSPKFGVWCDQQIKALLSGNHQHFDWKKLRSEATSSFKVMQAILQETRKLAEKPTARYHFINESRLVNEALTGSSDGLERDDLSAEELEFLAKIEERNVVLIGMGLAYDLRKQALAGYARMYTAPKRLTA